MQDTRQRCVKCGGIVDPKGVNGGTVEYCDCVCRYPIGGCGARITFLVNLNQVVQPFNLDGIGGPHHATCTSWRTWKRLQRSSTKPAREDIAALGQKSLEAFR